MMYIIRGLQTRANKKTRMCIAQQNCIPVFCFVFWVVAPVDMLTRIVMFLPLKQRDKAIASQSSPLRHAAHAGLPEGTWPFGMQHEQIKRCVGSPLSTGR